MTSDDSTKTSRPLPFAGPGLALTMVCIACGKKRNTLGSGVRLYAGSRQRVCASCKGEKR